MVWDAAAEVELICIVAQENPYSAQWKEKGAKWAEIASIMVKRGFPHANAKGCQQRMKTILRAHEKQSNSEERESGTPQWADADGQSLTSLLDDILQVSFFGCTIVFSPRRHLRDPRRRKRQPQRKRKTRYQWLLHSLSCSAESKA